MQRLVILSALLLIPAGATFAQASLQSQIDAVYASQQREQAAQDAAARAQDAAARAQQAEVYRAQQASEAASRARAAGNTAREHAREADAAISRQRDQAYEDKLRDQSFRQRELDLQARQVRVSRENDFINQELRGQAAASDVVQSQADATRNVSAGVQALLTDSGAAALKRAGQADNDGKAKISAKNQLILE